MKEIKIGQKAEVFTKVTSDKLAVAVGSGSLKVFATPSMCALMEEAACAAIAPFLDPDETTVGTSLNIEHTSPSPRGVIITAEAEIMESNGREITLHVKAFDAVGEIGNGTHKRYVVDAEKFQKKANLKK